MKATEKKFFHRIFWNFLVKNVLKIFSEFFFENKLFGSDSTCHTLVRMRIWSRLQQALRRRDRMFYILRKLAHFFGSDSTCHTQVRMRYLVKITASFAEVR